MAKPNPRRTVLQVRIFVTTWLQVEISGDICLRIESLQRTILYRDNVYTREGMPI